MREKERIEKLFENIYNGDPWIDITILGTLKNISAEQAASKPSPQWNSIWEIVKHIISWRLNVLQRVQGKIAMSPDHNYFVPLTDISEAAWQNILKSLEDSQREWLSFLKRFNDEDFEKIYAGNNHSYYEHIHGIIQHDVYHLGQIIFLAKHV